MSYIFIATSIFLCITHHLTITCSMFNFPVKIKPPRRVVISCTWFMVASSAQSVQLLQHSMFSKIFLKITDNFSLQQKQERRNNGFSLFLTSFFSYPSKSIVINFLHQDGLLKIAYMHWPYCAINTNLQWTKRVSPSSYFNPFLPSDSI